jgi:hypothetical protein
VLSADAVEGVAVRTGGVPLFIEEVTRLMLEGGAHAIPPTLQQSLAARLDRLGEAREIAQVGAVVGREFTYRLPACRRSLSTPGWRSCSTPTSCLSTAWHPIRATASSTR